MTQSLTPDTSVPALPVLPTDRSSWALHGKIRFAAQQQHPHAEAHNEKAL